MTAYEVGKAMRDEIRINGFLRGMGPIKKNNDGTISFRRIKKLL